MSFIWIVLSSPCFASSFLAPKDIGSPGSSNIKLKNNSGTDIVVYGLYIRQLAYLPIGGTSCHTATPIYSEDAAIGAIVMPVAIKANGEVPIGSNYLYNMIYGANYYAWANYFSSPGCELPGCTWGADTTIYNWCIELGALAPVAVTSSFTSNVPPSTREVSGSGYDYEMVNNYISLGPISCSDETLTCRAATAQTQPLPL